MVRPFPLLGLSDLSGFSGAKHTLDEFIEGYQSHCWRESGAAALAEICQKIGAQKKRTVTLWLPGYFCGQSLRYLRASDVRLIFYPLKDSLEPDYAFVREHLPEEGMDAFLHVHYFGRIIKQDQSRQLADQFRAVLIEDCAHVMSPSLHQDWLGDYLLFSPHKHFPLPSIGLVISRVALSDGSVLSAKFPVRWLLKQLLKKWLPIYSSATWQEVWSSQREQLKVHRPHSKVIVAAVNWFKRTDELQKIRREHAIRLLELLQTVDGWSPVDDEVQAAPYLLVMQCDSVELAKRRFALLNKREQLVMQWPDLPEEIRDVPEIERQCHAWMNRRLFFFIHQQLDMNDWISAVERKISMEGF